MAEGPNSPDGGGAGRTVLVVDDDADVRQTVAASLSGLGDFQVLEAGDGENALATIARHRPDLMILDLMLPGLSGVEVLRQVRRGGDLPVIILTARGEEAHRVLGLELGADDYLVKPFSMLELAARVRSVLRRVGAYVNVSQLHFDGLSVDTAAHEVRVHGEIVPMTAKEFDLLAHLTAAPRRVFSAEQLLEWVWGAMPGWLGVGTVKEHVRRLRQKIEPDPAHPRWIVTVRGAGYRFDP